MSVRTSLTRLVVAAPMAGLLVAGIGVGAAGASEADGTTRSTRAAATGERAGTTLDAVRTRCRAAVDERFTALDRLSRALAERTAVTAEHRATIEGQIAATRDGLATLRSAIEADTDGATLRQHCSQIVTEHRVYLLVVPRTREVLAADTVVAGADRLAARTGDLAAAIDAAEAAGQDVSAARELFAGLQADLSAARDAAAGVPDAVLGLTAADWNAGTARPVLEAGHGTLRQARTALADALRAAHQILQDLAS
jgi:hypothetical protein